jgi:hypothetical protein
MYSVGKYAVIVFESVLDERAMVKQLDAGVLAGSSAPVPALMAGRLSAGVT